MSRHPKYMSRHPKYIFPGVCDHVWPYMVIYITIYSHIYIYIYIPIYTYIYKFYMVGILVARSPVIVKGKPENGPSIMPHDVRVCRVNILKRYQGTQVLERASLDALSRAPKSEK